VGEVHVPVIPFPILTACPNILFGSEPAKTLNLGHLHTLKFYLLWKYIYFFVFNWHCPEFYLGKMNFSYVVHYI
jgi:hypothetical protein